MRTLRVCGTTTPMTKKQIAIIGAGPAGLAAAQALSGLGHDITIYEAMPTPARKFLWAGKSGLNITHAEQFETFQTRFGAANARLSTALEQFTPDHIRAWATQLGVETFIGSSGRVFPKAMKASPLLRAWLAELEAAGVQLKTRHKWCGFDGDQLMFETQDGTINIKPDAVILALGGASYQRLGSTAEWEKHLTKNNVTIAPLQPANCGFDVQWSEFLVEKFAGAPVKTVEITLGDKKTKGEFVISKSGVEGSLIYAFSAQLRDQLETNNQATLQLDLVPGKTAEQIADALARQNPKHSLSNRLRKGAKLTGVKAALVRELYPEANKATPEELGQRLKALELPLLRTRPIDEAISTAGGVAWDQIDENYMLKQMPGVFVAGEMIDWEAPTGGYLITACLATGRAAGAGAKNWLTQTNEL